MSLFGLGSKKTKTSSYIDPKTQAAQWANYDDFGADTPKDYTPTSADQIGSYFNPYLSKAVGAAQDDLERQRQLAVQQTGDAAMKAGAFGGSRHGVAEGETNDAFARAAASQYAGMENTGWQQALQAAQDENKLSYFYPLQRQGVANQTLAEIDPQRFTTSKTQDPKAAFSNFGKVLDTGAKIASFFV